MNTEQITHAVKGAAGIGTILLTDTIPVADMSEVIKLIIQAVVAIGTLYHMWKSRGNNNDNTPTA